MARSVLLRPVWTAVPAFLSEPEIPSLLTCFPACSFAYTKENDGQCTSTRILLTFLQSPATSITDPGERVPWLNPSLAVPGLPVAHGTVWTALLGPGGQRRGPSDPLTGSTWCPVSRRDGEDTGGWAEVLRGQPVVVRARLGQLGRGPVKSDTVRSFKCRQDSRVRGDSREKPVAETVASTG